MGFTNHPASPAPTNSLEQSFFVGNFEEVSSVENVFWVIDGKFVITVLIYVFFQMAAVPQFSGAEQLAGGTCEDDIEAVCVLRESLY